MAIGRLKRLLPDLRRRSTAPSADTAVNSRCIARIPRIRRLQRCLDDDGHKRSVAGYGLAASSVQRMISMRPSKCSTTAVQLSTQSPVLMYSMPSMFSIAA